MADKRIFQLDDEGFLDDLTDKVYMWLDKKANEGELQEPSWKFKANVFLKILNNFATKFVPNVATVEGKCYWHDGELFVCDTAYTGDWVPGNFTATTIDALFARKDVQSALQDALNTTNGNVTALTTYAQNVAHSIAPEFDPTRDYVVDDICTYEGTAYIFTSNHPAGAWNPAEVEIFVAGETLKFFVVTNNPEYLYAVVDNNARFLFGVKVDGSFEWSGKFPKSLEEVLNEKVDKENGKSLVDSEFSKMVRVESNDEYVFAILDSEDRLLFFVKKDGDVGFGCGVPLETKNSIDMLRASVESMKTSAKAFQCMPRCAVIGDSLSSGFTSYNAVVIGDSEAKKFGINWPSYIARRNGIYFLNASVAGSSAKSWRDGNQDISVLNQSMDAFFVALGYNDRSYSIGTSSDIAGDYENNADSFYGNYDYIVRKLHSFCASAKVFVMTMPNYVVGYGEFNEAVRYIASQYSYVCLLDLEKEDAFYAPWFGSLIVDGTHFSPYGYNAASLIIEKCVNDFVSANSAMFSSFNISGGTVQGVPGSVFIENPEYAEAKVDNDGNLLEAMEKNGKKRFFTKLSFDGGVDWSDKNLKELETALREYGFTGGQGDWSEDDELKIPMPKFALLNFSNIETFPSTKTADLHAIMEFWDMNGNFFKKKVVLNAQGNSSLAYPKKNLSIDICNDDWIGDDTFKLKIGDWVTQDSFHIKAFYTDYFRGTGEIGYSLYKEILDTRGIKKNRSWKLALVSDNDNYGQGLGYGAETSETLRIDDGALCFPEGFPCLVYLNGSFNGIYAFQLKKHRDNYMMKKDNKKHIHLDGVLNTDFFCGTIDWTAFEVRNPKNLYCMDGSKYDGDDPQELIDPTSASYDPNNSKHVNTYAVKQSIIALSQVYSLVSAASTDEEKMAIVEEYFNVDNLVDYQIFCDIIYNVDGVAKNWQWTTWDGHKWFANAYDLDMSFGAMYTGDVIHKPATSHVGVLAGLPNTYILSLYSGDLEARYAELRNNGVADAERIAAKFDTWVKSIGADAFKKEWELWNDSPCNRDMVINTDYWDISLTDGKPDIVYATQGHSVYSSSVTYSAGDEVIYCPTAAFTSQGWWYVFTCKASCSGEAPVTKPGFRDNLWRVKNWLAKTVENMDTLYNYSNQ